MIERAEVCGGASSWSRGWAWAPGNPLARADGVDEDRKTFRTYLRAALGEDYQAEKIEAFLEAAPRMVEFFHEHTELRFVPGAKIRDIYGKLPGAGTGHRSVGPAPYDAREIRPELLQKLRRQLYATSFLGMGIMAGPDLTKFLSASQGSPSGLLHATRRVSRHMFDLALHRRGLQLVNGTALIGRLARSADDLGVELRVRTEAVELTVDDDGRITGAIVKGPDGRREIRARRGVVLAAGGFPRNMRMRAELFPRTEHGRDHWTLAPEQSDGAGIRLGTPVGAHLRTDLGSAATSCPVSLAPTPAGAPARSRTSWTAPSPAASGYYPRASASSTRRTGTTTTSTPGSAPHPRASRSSRGRSPTPGSCAATRSAWPSRCPCR